MGFWPMHPKELSCKPELSTTRSSWGDFLQPWLLGAARQTIQRHGGGTRGRRRRLPLNSNVIQGSAIGLMVVGKKS